jgi:DNA polymerase III gamma/tau subunit
MIIKYPKINYDDLFNKIKYICNIENINYDDASIHTLLFVSDNDIRKAINNLECIYYSYNKLDEESIYKLIDKPKPYYIIQILENCYKNDYTRCIKIIKELSSKGYTPNDILSIFMKFLFEYKNDIEYNNIILNDEIKLAIYDIISTSYIIINDGVDTLLQLCGCISKIFIYLQTNK